MRPGDRIQGDTDGRRRMSYCVGQWSCKRVLNLNPLSDQRRRCKYLQGYYYPFSAVSGGWDQSSRDPSTSSVLIEINWWLKIPQNDKLADSSRSSFCFHPKVLWDISTEEETFHGEWRTCQHPAPCLFWSSGTLSTSEIELKSSDEI